MKDIDNELEQFFRAIGPLSDKILALLIQLPPSLHIFEGLQSLRELVPRLDTRFRYAVEVRHTSWFQDLAYNFFVNNDICMVWSPVCIIVRIAVFHTVQFRYDWMGDIVFRSNDFHAVTRLTTISFQRL